MDQQVASNTEEAVKTVEDEVPKLDSDVDMTDAKVEQSVSGTDEKPDDHKSEKCEADKLPREVVAARGVRYLPPEPGLPVFSTAAPHHRPIAYDEYEDDNGVSRVAYLRSILLTQPVSVPPPMQFRMPVSGGETLLDEEERRRLAVKADGRRKEIRASSVLPYTMDFRKALAEYLEQRGIHLEVVHDLHSANRSEATSKGLPYRCTVYWYQQPNGGGRVDFDGGYQSDERVAVQAAAHAAITLKGIPLEEFLEKNCSEFGNLIIPATTARLRKMLELQEGGDDELIDFKVEERTVIDVGEERKGFQCKAKVAKWGEGVEVTGGWHISPLDAKYDCCQRVWSKIDAKEQAERDKIAAEKMAKERADREARMKEQLEKDREMREKLAKAQKEKLEKEREARIKAAPVRTSAVAANYSEKRQMSRPDGPGMAADNKRQRLSASANPTPPSSGYGRPQQQQQQQQQYQAGHVSSMPRRESPFQQPHHQQQHATPARQYSTPAPGYPQQMAQYPTPLQQQQQHAVPPASSGHMLPAQHQPAQQQQQQPRPVYGAPGSTLTPQWPPHGLMANQSAAPYSMATATAAVPQARPTYPTTAAAGAAASGADMASRAAQMSAAASYYGQQAVRQQQQQQANMSFGRHAAPVPAATQFAHNAGQTSLPVTTGYYPPQQQAARQQQSSTTAGMGIYGGASSSAGHTATAAAAAGQANPYAQQQTQGAGPPFAGQAVRATSSLEEYAAALATYQKQMAEYAAKCSAYYAQQQQQQRQQQ